VISLGKKDASYLFVAFLIASYLCIIAGVLTKMMPALTLIGLGTIGFGWRAAKGALEYYDNNEKTGSNIGRECHYHPGNASPLSGWICDRHVCFIKIY